MKALRFLHNARKIAGFAALLTLAPHMARAQTVVSVPEARISLQVPIGSTVMTRQTPGAVAKHSAGWVMDVGGPTVANYRTNFNLRTGAAEPNAVYNLNSASKMSQQFKQGFPSARNIAFGTLTVNGEKAVSIIGTITMPKHVIRTKIIQFAHAGTRYTFTFTAADSAFYRQVGAFDKSVASVKWQ